MEPPPPPFYENRDNSKRGNGLNSKLYCSESLLIELLLIDKDDISENKYNV